MSDDYARPLEESIGFLLSRAAARLGQAANQALAAEGLRVRSYSALRLACENPDGISQKDVAEAMGLDPSQLVALLDNLQGKELVERRSDPNDRRSKLLFATEEGRRVCRRAAASVEQVDKERLAHLPEWVIDGLRDTLQKIVTPQ